MGGKIQETKVTSHTHPIGLLVRRTVTSWHVMTKDDKTRVLADLEARSKLADDAGSAGKRLDPWREDHCQPAADHCGNDEWEEP
jgi:hypothetical protein